MRIIFVIIIFISSSVITYSQCNYDRYREFIFEDISVSANVVYGNSPSWFFPFQGIDLEMDIYQPLSDAVELRPAIIWVHSGGFLLGDKEAEDMVALCENFAKKGYVTASINYRLGFNVLSNGSAQRAVYRGVQDTRAAYRYLVENAIALKIDPTKIFIGGSSAGGFATLHTGYLDEDERPGSTFDFPNLGCLDCEGNGYNHDVDPLGLISLWGAIGDTTWIDSDENTALYMAHGTNDETVSFNTGPPFGFFVFDDLYGSLPVSQRLNSHGLDYSLTVIEGGEHEPHGTDNGDWPGEPTEFWYQMNDEITNFCLNLIKPDAPIIDSMTQVCLGDTLFISFDTNLSTCYTGQAEWIESEGLLALIYSDLGILTDSLYLENNISALSEVTFFSIEVVQSGCTDITACNFDEFAICDDGTCEFETCNECLYDVVQDGIINILDLLAISSDFGCFEDCIGDATGDGLVNILDLITISGFFGLECP